MDKEVQVIEKPNKIAIRNRILAIEAVMRRIPGSFIGDTENCPLKHTFVDGAYVREIFMPKGMLITSKIHKFKHPYFVLKGDVSVMTEDGPIRIKAPFSGITPVGTKRLLYIHEDTIWITVHVTEETDLKKIESKIIAKNFKELGMEAWDIEGAFEEEALKLLEFVEKEEK